MQCRTGASGACRWQTLTIIRVAGTGGGELAEAPEGGFDSA